MGNKLTFKQNILFSIVLLLFLGVGTYAFVKATKITDPQNPEFNPYRFSYADYSGDHFEMVETLKKVFICGEVDETFVDRVLVDSAGSRKSFRHGPNDVLYHKFWATFGAVISDFIWIVHALYDSNHKLVKMELGGSLVCQK